MTNSRNDKKRTKHRKVIMGVVIAAIAAAGMFVVPNSVRSNINNSYKNESIEKRDITNYYSFAGVVEAKNRQNIIAKEMMQISEILVNEGDEVKKDDIIFKTSKGNEIKSDIDGEVSKIYIDENSQVLGGTKLIDIVDYENLQVSIKIDEYDISSIEQDQDMEVQIDSIGKSIKGVVSKISREAININGVSYFTANIDLDHDEEIRVGMNAETKMLNEKAENVMTISIEAVQFTDENEPYVLVGGENNTITEKRIEVGVNDGLFVEITSGVDIDETVLVPKKATIDEGGFRPPFAGGDR